MLYAALATNLLLDPVEVETMFRLHKSRLILGAALLAAGLVTSARADTSDKKTIVTFSETVAIPGAVLPPGQYVIKLVDSESNRHIVQFLNADETLIYNTVVAIPNERMRRTGKTAFTYYEMPAGHPVALKAWFYPGDVIGQEFAYPASRDGEFFQHAD
jgi:hypothetical protein